MVHIKKSLKNNNKGIHRGRMGRFSAASQATSPESQNYFSSTGHLCWLLLQVWLSLYQNACSIFLFCFVFT